jgi:hypothetical protein
LEECLDQNKIPDILVLGDPGGFKAQIMQIMQQTVPKNYHKFTTLLKLEIFLNSGDRIMDNTTYIL